MPLTDLTSTSWLTGRRDVAAGGPVWQPDREIPSSAAAPRGLRYHGQSTARRWSHKRRSSPPRPPGDWRQTNGPELVRGGGGSDASRTGPCPSTQAGEPDRF